MTVLPTFSVTYGPLTQPFSLPGFERHVCGWEAWLPHVCVWVHSPLCQHPPRPQWPTEKGHPLWRDSDRGEEGVPSPPGRAGRVQRILLASPGWTDKRWPRGQLAWRGTVTWCVFVWLLREVCWLVFLNTGKGGGRSYMRTMLVLVFTSHPHVDVWCTCSLSGMNAKWACFFKEKEPHLGPRPLQFLLHLNFGVWTVGPQSDAVLCVGFESRLCLLSFKWIIRFPLRTKQRKNSQDLPCLGIKRKKKPPACLTTNAVRF